MPDGRIPEIRPKWAYDAKPPRRSANFPKCDQNKNLIKDAYLPSIKNITGPVNSPPMYDSNVYRTPHYAKSSSNPDEIFNVKRHPVAI